MTHKVAANYTMPAILNTLKPAANVASTKAASSAGSASGTVSGSATSGGLGSTFLSLLVKELQNQDPTSPMDSTAMVGQMISLNQLDQLISINQKTAATPGTATGKTQSAGALASVAAAARGNAASTLSAAAKGELPYLDPAMPAPFSSGPGNAGATSLNTPLNAATLGYPGFDNTFGGK